MKLYFRRGIWIILITYILLLSYWMIWGFGRSVHSQYMYNIIPFRTIQLFMEIEHFNPITWFINLIGNIGVFIPFGLLLPMVFRRGYFITLGTFLIGLFLLETIQLVTRRGSFDIDDFILNGIGFTIGYVVYKYGRKVVG